MLRRKYPDLFAPSSYLLEGVAQRIKFNKLLTDFFYFKSNVNIYFLNNQKHYKSKFYQIK